MTSPSTDRRLSRRVVWITVAAVLVGLALGVLPGISSSQVPEHRPEQNAIVPHVVIGVVVFGAALAITWVTRSVRWVWWPISADAGARYATTFRLAPRSFVDALRCVVVVLLTLFIVYLVLRMGMQITAGRNREFTVNAWGGPSALGAFLAHGVDAVLGIGLLSALTRLVLHRPQSRR